MGCRLGMKTGRWLLVCALVGWLSGCGHPARSPVDRERVQLSQQGFVEFMTLPHIKAWLKHADVTNERHPSGVLQVYLEGDGAPWWAQRLPPVDPTPRTSVSLPLALGDTHDRVAYVGRPCQFLTTQARESCPAAWWTSGRWSEPVITMTQQVLDGLLEASGARELVLTGHSGGGTLALLVAARRQDVRCVLTLASPLDLDAWAQAQGVAPLSDSRNPAQELRSGTRLQTLHFLGAEDRVVPPTSVGRYGARLQPGQLVVVPHQGHVLGWVNWWRGTGDTQARLTAWLGDCLKPL